MQVTLLRGQGVYAGDSAAWSGGICRGFVFRSVRLLPSSLFFVFAGGEGGGRYLMSLYMVHISTYLRL